MTHPSSDLSNPFDVPSAVAAVAPPPGSLQDASVGARISGAMIDYLTCGLLLLAPVIGGFLLAKPLVEADKDLLIGTSVLAGFGMYTALQAFLISTQGQSLGKVFAGTRIVRPDGSPVGFFHGVLLRSWAWTVICQLPLISLFATMGDLITLFGADRRTLHDRIADTRVVSVYR
jgi:uncharacterized RDD family membrane protein YckC